jgi:hypothetical protein
MDRLTAGAGHVMTVYTDDGSAPEERVVHATDLWVPELAAFLDAIETDIPTLLGTGEQARTALAVAVAANKSLESGVAEDV